MKFIQIVMVLLCINLTLALFTFMAVSNDGILGLDGLNGCMKSTETVSPDGNITETDISLAYKIEHWNKDDGNVRKYLNKGVQDPNQQYLQSGGDFIQGLFIFYEVVLKGMVLIVPTLRNLCVPANLTWYFVIPIWLLYAFAIIQLVSGRNLNSGN